MSGSNAIQSGNSRGSNGDGGRKALWSFSLSLSLKLNIARCSRSLLLDSRWIGWLGELTWDSRPKTELKGVRRPFAV